MKLKVPHKMTSIASALLEHVLRELPQHARHFGLLGRLLVDPLTHDLLLGAHLVDELVHAARQIAHLFRPAEAAPGRRRWNER